MKNILSAMVVVLTLFVIQRAVVAAENPAPLIITLPAVVVSPANVDDEPSEINTKTERLFNVAGTSLDPLVSLQALPGIATAGDYSIAPAIRGSAPDENAYFIDMIPARYLFHDFGNSIFNENLIRSFDLYPAAFGSQYHNATGAVIDVVLRDPRHQPFTTTVDWSFLKTGLLFESEVNPGQAFYVSYRRSLIDIFAKKEDIVDKESGIAIDSLPIADDYQFKYIWQLDSENQLSAIAAGARDQVAATFQQNSNEALRDPDFAGPASSSRGFDSQGLTWNHNPVDGNSRLKTVLMHGTENDNVHYGTGQYVNIDADRNLLRTHYGQRLNEAHWLTLGLGSEQTEYLAKVRAKIVPCSAFDPDCPTIDAPLYLFEQPLNLNINTTYVEDQWQFNKQLRVTSGLNYMTDDYLDQQAWQPRLHLHYTVNEAWAVKSAVGQYAQLPHVEDIINIVGNPNLHYMDATHYVLGLENKPSNAWTWTLDGYYKDLRNIVISIQDNSYGDFANNYSNDASGQAYGVEFLLSRNLAQQWDGWLAVSLSRTERLDERTGETRPFDYDRPVMINWVANYHHNAHWNFGLKWSLRSGGLYTPVVEVKPNMFNAAVMEPVYGELNSERLPLYHRLDVSAEYLTTVSIGYLSLFADILNVYNQRNIEGYSYSPNGSNLEDAVPDGFGADVPVSADEGFPFFPSIGFKLEF